MIWNKEKYNYKWKALAFENYQSFNASTKTNAFGIQVFVPLKIFSIEIVMKEV